MSRALIQILKFAMAILMVLVSLQSFSQRKPIDNLVLSGQIDSSNYSDVIDGLLRFSYYLDSPANYLSLAHQIKRIITVNTEPNPICKFFIAKYHSQIYNSDSAIIYATSALQDYQQQANTYMVANCRYYLAQIYWEQKMFDEAGYNYMESYELYSALDEQEHMSYCLCNVGIIKSNMGNYDQGKFLLKGCLKTMLKANDSLNYAGALFYLSQLYNELDSVDAAHVYAKQALDFYERTEDNLVKGIINITLGEIAFKQGSYDKARRLLIQSEQYINVTGRKPELLDLCRVRTKLESKLKNFEEAFKYQSMFMDLVDSLDLSDRIKKYRQELKDKSQEEHVSFLERINKQESEQKKLVSFVGIVVVLTLSFIAFVLYRSRNLKAKMNAVLSARNVLIEEKNKEILDSINYAKRIQSAILPPQKLVKEYLRDSFILYKPKDIVAGDFYWFETIDDKIYFAAADCTGHGVPGAMVSVMCSNALTKCVKELGITSPAKILDKAVELIESRFERSEEDVKDGMDLALCCLDITSNEVIYAGANNPLWIVRSSKLNAEDSADAIDELKADKMPVGKYAYRKPYLEHCIQLHHGDTIYIFSDGFPDQFGGSKGKKFKYKPFKRLLVSINEKTMEQQRIDIDNAFTKWKGDLEQIDDVCVIGVRV